VRPEDIAGRVDEAGIRLVRFLWCGNDGTVRAKASGRHGLEGRLASGIGVTVGIQAMNALDHLQAIEGLGPVGEHRLVPDPETFVVLPYAPNAAALVCDNETVDGRPAPVCQRSFLKRMIARLADRGTLEVAFENEFSLALATDGGYAPIDSSLCFSTIGMTASQDYADELAAALEAQGLELEQYYAELGHGQQELSTAHAPALRAADRQLLVRETIRGVAIAQGIVASLAPKPWPEAAGNGCHIHFSLWDEAGGNLFYDGDSGDGLTDAARSFVAGLLEHLSGLCGLTAPSFNSYHRLVPRYWAGAFTCWGLDNREAPVRVPSRYRGSEEASTNVELKAADATSNPHLAVGGLIAAGLDGLERKLQAPPPVQFDPATMPEDERERQGIRRLPATQAEALDALEGDAVLMDALGPGLAGSYLAVRRSEWDLYSIEDEEFEQQGHFLKY
jgi:glutamine synthetase